MEKSGVGGQGSGIKALIPHSEIRLRWIFVVSLPISFNNRFIHLCWREKRDSLRLRGQRTATPLRTSFAGVYPERSEGDQNDIFDLNCLKDE